MSSMGGSADVRRPENPAEYGTGGLHVVGTFTKQKSPSIFAYGFVPAFNWSDRPGSSLILSAR